MDILTSEARVKVPRCGEPRASRPSGTLLRAGRWPRHRRAIGKDFFYGDLCDIAVKPADWSLGQRA
jgi:hypothetical protein